MNFTKTMNEVLPSLKATVVRQFDLYQKALEIDPEGSLPKGIWDNLVSTSKAHNRLSWDFYMRQLMECDHPYCAAFWMAEYPILSATGGSGVVDDEAPVSLGELSQALHDAGIAEQETAALRDFVEHVDHHWDTERLRESLQSLADALLCGGITVSAEDAEFFSFAQNLPCNPEGEEGIFDNVLIIFHNLLKSQGVSVSDS